MFITFEGGEGAGKTTLIQGIERHLHSLNLSTITTREPGSTPFGEQVRNILLHTEQDLHPQTELQLFLAARAQHLHDVILPALNSNTIVLCDRFNDSTIAYQGFARGLDPTQVSIQCELTCGGHQPDLTFYLDVDPELALTRLSGSPDRIESEKLDFHQRIRNGFQTLAEANPDRIVTLDASQTPDQVLQSAVDYLQQRLPMGV